VTAARIAAILMHGRGATAEDIMTLADELRLDDVTYAAPQAAGRTWYPHSFLAPIDQNEPGLTSAIAVVGRLVDEFAAGGIAADRVAILGFSQGACLALESAARRPRRYRAILGLSGGLIGPPGGLLSYEGTLDGTPVLLGCSDVDSHIPLVRVQESSAIFRSLGATVDERIYPGMGHTVNRDELDAVRQLLEARVS
jgi:predicted esterase